MFVYFSVPTFVAFLKEVESPYEVRLQDVCFKYVDNNHLFSLVHCFIKNSGIFTWYTNICTPLKSQMFTTKCNLIYLVNFIDIYMLCNQ